jgi:hypothetical protein
VVPLFVLGVPVLLGSSVEVVPDVLLPEPLVVPEPVAEPEPLVVPVGDDDLSEQPDNPIPRLKDMSAAVNKYLWFCIAPLSFASNRYARLVQTATNMPFSNLVAV